MTLLVYKCFVIKTNDKNNLKKKKKIKLILFKGDFSPYLLYFLFQYGTSLRE